MDLPLLCGAARNAAADPLLQNGCGASVFFCRNNLLIYTGKDFIMENVGACPVKSRLACCTECGPKGESRGDGQGAARLSRGGITKRGDPDVILRLAVAFDGKAAGGIRERPGERSGSTRLTHRGIECVDDNPKSKLLEVAYCVAGEIRDIGRCGIPAVLLFCASQGKAEGKNVWQWRSAAFLHFASCRASLHIPQEVRQAAQGGDEKQAFSCCIHRSLPMIMDRDRIK